ncbi:hypothetical protein NDU88_001465 [Pleurodeles waltl]|uniref:Uncharacterized protein n=1 Tax=Pleurodeles waltl TaxID=8319 RepID=A0AAV7RAG1_PLEWA|nr:hypothetical protein NDU88_001465 [Pleurodeles waltl]
MFFCACGGPVLRSGTNQADFPGEEGQKKALRTATERSKEEKAERGGRDGESDSGGKSERNSSSNGGSEDSKPRERDGDGEPGDGREENGRGRPGGSLEEESSTGRRSGNQEAAQQTLSTFWEERCRSRCVGQNVLNSGGRRRKPMATE